LKGCTLHGLAGKNQPLSSLSLLGNVSLLSPQLSLG